MSRVDAIVLGAGIVGVSAALHLLKRGKSVALVDRRAPGEETSHGNAGVIERDGFVPITFPGSLSALATYALNRSPQAHYHPRFLSQILPWLWQFRQNSSSVAVDRFARAIDQLERHAAAEHRALASDSSAQHYFRSTGWIRLYRSEASFKDVERELHYARIFGAAYDILEPSELNELEPHLRPLCHKAVFWKDSESVSSPGGVTKAYADSFVAKGGALHRGDALSLRREGDGWAVETDTGTVGASDVVVALGPWSMDLLKLFGYQLPLAVKRGYHVHYRALGNATLSRPIVDTDKGYVLTPMERGIRLTTGIEFAARDAEPTPVQIRRTSGWARELFPLDTQVDQSPWMGARPCFPDSLPMVGRSPRHAGLWFDFGHAHTGFTNGPVTGRLLAEMMTGARTIVDPAPYSPGRFVDI